MANYHGKNADVLFSSLRLMNSAGASWGLETSNAIVDTTGFQAISGWESQVNGITDFNATAEGVADLNRNYASALAVSAPLVIKPSASVSFTGTAICTSVAETVEVSGVGRISFGFEGNDSDGLSFA